jgi:Flp pilus assembly protein TadD
MKKLILLSLMAVLGACATRSNDSTSGDSGGGIGSFSDSAAADSSPQIDEDVAPGSSSSSRAESPKAYSAPASPVQQNSLSEAVKSQNDERIYHVATQILASSPNDPKALNALAMYHYKKSRPELSRYLLSKAISANPRQSELYSNLGIVQLAQNENREAVKSFRKALEINGNDAVAAANVGAIYIQEQDYQKAQTALETAYRKGMRDPRLLNNYAIALTAQGKYDQARDLYQQALKENSNNKEALFNLAVLLVDHMNKFSEAMDIINRLKFVGGPADTRSRINALENKAKAGLK